jgi:hypothetical protein
MKRLAAGVMALALLSGGTTSVRADAVYHTERLTLNPVGGASGTGMVVNIHPNGPEVYAIEQYQLSGAEPGETYLVWLHLYIGAEDCADDPVGSLNTAQIETNVAGNGTGQLVLTPEDIAAAGLQAGMSFPISWTVTQDGVTTHATDCTIVTLD